jgi:hypothetical protein
MVIRILDMASGADTADQAVAVFARLHDAMSEPGEQVTISFDGVKTATSSFVNVAFVQLLVTHSLREIKSRLRIVKSTRQINDMIRTRMEREGSFAA